MSDEAKSDETTPAGSYRLPGQDTSGYLGVDDEYMNSSGVAGQAILTPDEEYLFLPAPEEGAEEGADEDESDDEGADKVNSEGAETGETKPVEVAPEDPRVQVNPTPARPAL